MKSAGKARNNGLYRHIRTSKEIIRNLLNDYYKSLKKHLKSPCKCVIIFRGHFTSRCFCDIITVVLQPCKKVKLILILLLSDFYCFLYQ